MWQFHYTTFRLVCQPIVADQPQNFIFHRFLGGFAEVDTNFIGHFEEGRGGDCRRWLPGVKAQEFWENVERETD